MKFLKNIELTHIAFYISSISVIVIASFFDEKLIAIALPATITCLLAIYIKKAKQINFWYLGNLLVMLVCNLLIYLDFVRYFLAINILITLYHLLSVMSLKAYIDVKKIKTTNFSSFSLIIGITLIIYLIYAIVDLIFDFLLPYIGYAILTVVALIAYVIVSYLIYKTDMYKGGIKLLIASYIWMFVHALTPINEITIHFRVFTVLIITTHIIGLYLFLTFLINNEPKQSDIQHEKFL